MKLNDTKGLAKKPAKTIDGFDRAFALQQGGRFKNLREFVEHLAMEGGASRSRGKKEFERRREALLHGKTYTPPTLLVNELKKIMDPSSRPPLKAPSSRGAAPALRSASRHAVSAVL